MKRAKVLLASIGFVMASALSTGMASAASVDGVNLRCPTQDGEFTSFNTDVCDLSVDKTVSVNGGAFVEADGSASAALAHVGDTVTWQITLSNASPDGLTPQGTVYVKDVLPSGVSLTSYSASAGDYVTDQAAFFANMWYLPAPDTSATLTIVTKATTVGTFDNTAVLSKYDPGSCDGGCIYADADATNDSDDAWLNVQTAPQVLGDSTTTPQVLGAATLANTGINTLYVSIFAGLTMTAAIATYLPRRKYNLHK